MNSVLDAVHQCLGIAITVPGTPSLEPVFLQLGPGPANRILSDLLGMTDFDYLVLSAQDHPEKITKVELLARNGEAGAATSTTATSTSTEGLSAARIAWLAERNLGRGIPPKEDDASPAAEEPKQPGPPQVANSSSDGPKAAALEASTENAAAAGSSLDPHATTDPVATATASSPANPAPGGAGQASAANQEFENKITDMQRLFEQRKKLNGAAADQSVPGPGSTPTSSSETNPSTTPL